MNLPSQNAKYLLGAIIWIGVFILGAMIALSGSLSGVGTGGLMGGALFIGASLATGFLFNWGQGETSESVQQQHSGKAKNDQRGIDPMSLLTDEDIAEMREDIKANMRRRLMEDSEETSFEALLSDASEQRKRR